MLLRAVLPKPGREIMRTENFKSVGAVQQTYKREMARRRLSERGRGDTWALVGVLPPIPLPGGF